MSYDLNGKHVLVTGASAGIGAALAEGFARRGATVGLCARRSDRLDEVLARCRVHAPESRAWTVDLADLDGLAGFAQRASQDLGGVDVLVNNAGIPKRKPVFDLTPEIVESVMRINYFSPVRLTLALLDELVARAGRLVYVSSVAARLSPPAEAAYAATKAAISAWAECLQVDLRDTDVKLHVLYPGVIDTELFHLPDNDPLPNTGVEMLPVDAIVEPTLTMIEQDRLEVAVPDWFAEVFARRYEDVAAFTQGTIAFARSQVV
ncbi:MAG TPA: SDR family NAD(P)-dependent oxidoreductase [Acidimicrobiia bacterium]|nr:SDR family NAD(P)-dependent oxidoreductase [Acidimicrobiia bacterium]